MAKNKIGVLIVGAGHWGTALLKTLYKGKTANVLGVVDISDEAPGMKLARELGIPTDKNYRKFLGKKELDEIINLSGDKKVQEELLRLKPPDVGLLDVQGAKLVWGLIQEHKEVEEALKKASAQNEQLIASISSIIIGVDENYRVARWNSVAEKTFGIPFAEVAGRPFEECGIQWDWDLVLKFIPGCQSEGRQKRVDDISFRRPDGKEGVLGVTINPLKGHGSRGFLILGKDITTERRILEIQLMQAQKLGAIGQLAAGAAHEINNPIGFINSNLTALDEYQHDMIGLINTYVELEKLVAKNPLWSDNRELVSVLDTIRRLKNQMDLDYIRGDIDNLVSESREGIERVKKIIQALKDFSHVDEAELKWTNLDQVLDRSLSIVWNEIKYKATVTKDYGHIPDVRCYPQQISQVFMNALINAAQAIEDRGEIRIATRYLEAEEPMVEIRISDTGEGIPAENLPFVFDPFFTTKSVGKGTGLGLSVSCNIVKKHSGEISVASEVGKGTTVIIMIPIAGPAEDEG